MRHYLKSLIITGIAFYVIYSLIPTISIGKDPRNLAIIIGSLFLVSNFVKPVFSLVLLPINHLTFGLVTFALNGALIYGLLRFLPGFTISPYSFPGAAIQGTIIPKQDFNTLASTLIVIFAFTLIQKILNFIFQ